MLVDLIDEHRGEFGVEFICRHLRVVPSTYCLQAARDRACRSEPRDEQIAPVVRRPWLDNRKVYGAHKIWKASRRGGHDICRDHLARLMRQQCVQGISQRRRKVFATVKDDVAIRPPDLVDCDFTAKRPDALWVTDLTYVPTR